MVKGEWEAYRNKLLSAQSSNIVAFSMIPTKELKAFLSLYDTTKYDTTNSTKSISSETSTQDSKKNIIDIFIKTYDNKMLSLGRFDSVLAKDFRERFIEDISFKQLINNKNIDSIAILISNNELEISNTINICDSILEGIGMLLISANDVETLISYTTYQEDSINEYKFKPYNFGLQKDSTKILRYKIAIPFHPIKSFVLYPLMLIFQTLIVLLIAIVGQLIISDKTITEAL